MKEREFVKWLQDYLSHRDYLSTFEVNEIKERLKLQPEPQSFDYYAYKVDPDSLNTTGDTIDSI